MKPIKKFNTVLKMDGIALLILTDSKGCFTGFSRVDIGDIPKINHCRWYKRTVRGKSYACTNVGLGKARRGLLLHTLLMNPSKGMEIDHINGDGLDNRRLNLRVCSHRNNTLNRKTVSKSGYKGVSKMKARWRAVIHEKQGCQTYLGSFKTPEEAAKAYNEAAIRLFGEYAWLNPI